MALLLVTLDTNQLDDEQLDRLRSAAAACSTPVDFTTVSVNERERGQDSQVQAVPETAVWDESRWGAAVWGDATASMLEDALTIVSNGSFPPKGARESLSSGHRRLLRDAMTFEAHVRELRHVLVSDDSDLSGPNRRPRLQDRGATWIVSSREFLEAAGDDRLNRYLEPPPASG